MLVVVATPRFKSEISLSEGVVVGIAAPLFKSAVAKNGGDRKNVAKNGGDRKAVAKNEGRCQDIWL